MLDFQEIKAAVRIEDVATSLLQLAFKTKSPDGWRGPCPACMTASDRTLAITPSKQMWYCFQFKRGGDCISLVAHIKGWGVKHAAQEIVDHFHLNAPQEPADSKSTAPQAVQEGTKTLTPLTYLVYDHEQVQTLGLDPQTAQALGIGFAPKGLMRGRVAVPLYRDGTLAGYFGLGQGCDVKVPTNLSEKIRAQ